MEYVGKPLERVDAAEKVRGTARYVDDLAFAGMLHARVLRSPHARAKIVRLETSAAEAVPGVVTLLTARDIPGKNLVPMIQQDQPLFAETEVRYAGEGVAMVAARSREAAEEALRRIVIEYEPLTPLLTIEQAFAKKETETFTHWQIRRGDPARAFREAAAVIERTYRTPYQEHAYIETNGCVALPDGIGGITIYASCQCPFYIQSAVAEILGIPHNQARVIQCVTGGGFGGKEDVPQLPGAMAALAAWKTGLPVKLVFAREEDMICMSKRHPALIHYRSAVAKDGTLLAVDVDYLLNGGAYATLSPVVLFRGVVHAAGPYRIANARVDASHCVRTRCRAARSASSASRRSSSPTSRRWICARTQSAWIP